LKDTLAVENRRIDFYQRLRSLRNKELYEGAIHVSVHDVEEAIEEAVWLNERLRDSLAKSFPQPGSPAP